MFASVMMAPWGSITVPEMEPLLIWAATLGGIKPAEITASRMKRLEVYSFIPTSLSLCGHLAMT
jgi:hypothetical protein